MKNEFYPHAHERAQVNGAHTRQSLAGDEFSHPDKRLAQYDHVDDLTLCFEETIVDISILVHPTDDGGFRNPPTHTRYQSSSPLQPEHNLSPKERPLYPSPEVLHSILPELSVSEILDKTRIVPIKAPIRREPSIVRRGGAETIHQLSPAPTRSFNNRHQGRSFRYEPEPQDRGLPQPGAYEFSGPNYMEPLRQKEEILRTKSSARYYDDVPEDDLRYGDERHGGDRPNGVIELEIEPGVMSHLRGSNETWQAIRRGFIVNVSCFGCEAPLVCIADAEYILCPDCKTISPAGTSSGYGKQAAYGLYPPHQQQQRGGGVGLGLRADHHDAGDRGNNYSY